MSTTRKQRGGSFWKTNATAKAASNLKAKRNYNLAHSKSRVANVLQRPGQFEYTHKQAIEGRYQEALALLRSVEQPKETATALQQLSASIDRALSSQTVRETGAVVITVPVGVAQLALKALRLFLSILIVVFIDLPLGFMSGSPAVNLAASVAPNTKFNTTASLYQKARQFTGANVPTTVKNY
jgi:hypothetical protein